MLGKYRIQRRLARGGFAEVYQAFDTVEGIRVALKIPYPQLVSGDSLDAFRREVRLTARLDHPNILPIKNAGFIGERFVIVTPLGEQTLAERLKSRISVKLALDYAGQMLEALAFAHRQRVMHCDVKPDNFLIFSGNRIRLADFGIARVAFRTVLASGSGTVGFMAPEQAMGRPSLRSDVFCLGLVLYRMLAGRLPEWPFEWPFPGHEKLRRAVHPDLVRFLQRALEVDPRRRFEDGVRMLAAFQRLRARTKNRLARRRKAVRPKGSDWKTVRLREFQRRYGRVLEARSPCPRCKGPMAQSMRACPWCGVPRKLFRGETRFPARCPRCRRGLKLDWRFCPWCYGGVVGPASNRTFSDRRYSARCANPACERKSLMPFLRYCPWCRRKVARRWPLEGSRERCRRCGWGVAGEFWSFCPWCGGRLDGQRRRAP